LGCSNCQLIRFAGPLRCSGSVLAVGLDFVLEFHERIGQRQDALFLGAKTTHGDRFVIDFSLADRQQHRDLLDTVFADLVGDLLIAQIGLRAQTCGTKIIGDLHGFHAAELLALSYRELIKRAGLEYQDVEYLAGGCVTQAGEQSSNITRTAWLSMGEDYTVGGTTLDTQCGSAQAANHMISSMISSNTFDIGIAAGVESMSRVHMGANVMNGPGFYQPENWPWDSIPDQFASAERIAEKRGITREKADEFACESQRRAAVVLRPASGGAARRTHASVRSRGCRRRAGEAT